MPNRWSFFGVKHEFMEARRTGKERLCAGHGGEDLLGVSGLSEVMLGQLTDAFFAVDGEEDGGHEGDERLIGADVRCGLFAADVLLACGEREDESTEAVAVGGLADEAAGHLAKIFFFRSDDSDIWATVAES